MSQNQIQESKKMLVVNGNSNDNIDSNNKNNQGETDSKDQEEDKKEKDVLEGGVEPDSIKQQKTKAAIVNKNFKKVRPYLYQLITHGVILFISIYAYLDYTTAEEIYTTFQQTLDTNLIVDIQTVSLTESCPTNYELINTTSIPTPKAGCRCDLGIYQESICSSIRDNLDINTTISFAKRKDNFTKECTLQDFAIWTKFQKRNLDIDIKFDSKIIINIL